MGIVFFCQSCGARFEVAPRMAGKKGRCKKCGQHMEIPRAEQLASFASMPALALAGAGNAPGASAGAKAPSMSSWLRAAASNVGLAPMTVDRMPIGMRRGTAPSPLDDAEDSKPYLVAGTDPGAPSHGRVAGAAGGAVRVWRREVGVVQRVFRWLNEGAYFVSIPFLMILLLGVAVQSRPTAMFGAMFVVLLNIGRIVAGVANLAVIPLRDGLNTKKMKKPLRRVVEPVVTIGLVLLAFTFIPWLSTSGPSGGTLTQRLGTRAKSLGEEMKGELGKTLDEARRIDVEKLGAQAREKLKTVGNGAGGGPDAATVPGTAGPSSKPAIGELIKDVGTRVRETVDESQKQP